MVVVRVWVECGVDGLRARITEVDELGADAEVTRTVSGIDEICEIVRAFLLRFAVSGEVTER